MHQPILEHSIFLIFQVLGQGLSLAGHAVLFFLFNRFSGEYQSESLSFPVIEQLPHELRTPESGFQF